MACCSPQRTEEIKRILSALQSSPHYFPPHRRLDSLRTLFKIGYGPSSSHTMGPRKAAEEFKIACPNAQQYEVILFGSLAQTGKGHKTDYAIYQVLGESTTKIIWNDKQRLKAHTNGMLFKGIDQQQQIILERVFFSIGGGILEYGEPEDAITLYSVDDVIPPCPPRQYSSPPTYDPLKNFYDHEQWCLRNNKMLTDLVYEFENKSILLGLNIPENEHHLYFKSSCLNSDSEKQSEICKKLIQAHLLKCWHVMKECVEDGLTKSNKSHGPVEAYLRYPRQAHDFHERALRMPLNSAIREALLIQAFSLAVSEQNGSAGHLIVTAPTCGACGVLPGILYFYSQRLPKCLNVDQIMVDALAVAGIVGNICRANASVSGAEAGCQAEIGVAEAMAAAAACFLKMRLLEVQDIEHFNLKSAISNIEYAARLSLVNRLGLTCDPVQGLVIYPCIQRNGASAQAAHQSALIAVTGINDNATSLDEDVQTMMETGVDMNSKYKETSLGGLAKNYALDAADQRTTDLQDEVYKEVGNVDLEDFYRK